jgi:hypothetical protein
MKIIISIKKNTKLTIKTIIFLLQKKKKKNKKK